MSAKFISFTLIILFYFTLSDALSQDEIPSGVQTAPQYGSFFLTKPARIGPTSGFLFTGSSYLNPETGDKFRGEMSLYLADRAEISVNKMDRVANYLAEPQSSPSWGIRFQLLAPDSGLPAVAAGLTSNLEWTTVKSFGTEPLTELGIFELIYSYFLTDFSITATKTFGSKFLVNCALSYQKLNYRNVGIWLLPLGYDRNYSHNTGNSSKDLLQASFSANLKINQEYDVFVEVQSIPLLLPVAGSDNLEFARAYQGSLNFRYYFLDDLGFDIGVWHQDDFKNIRNTQIRVGLNALVFI